MQRSFLLPGALSYCLHSLTLNKRPSLGEDTTLRNRISGSPEKPPESVKTAAVRFNPDLPPRDITSHWQVLDFTVTSLSKINFLKAL